MSAIYQNEYAKRVCKCRAHRQHLVFRALWAHPSAGPKDLSQLLKMSPNNVRQGLFRLRRRNLTALCPECMNERLFEGVCQSCGFEPSAPILPEVGFDSQSPTNHIHPGNELGSQVNYGAVGFTSNGVVVKRWIDASIESPLLRGVKSDVLQALKAVYPDEKTTDEAGRLVLKEVAELRARYPRFTTAKFARAQLGENVLNRMKLLHPRLRTVTLLRGDGHE